jgi:hypothetical protein
MSTELSGHLHTTGKQTGRCPLLVARRSLDMNNECLTVFDAGVSLLVDAHGIAVTSLFVELAAVKALRRLNLTFDRH